MKKYLLYLVRWQLSTPILSIVLIWLSDLNTLTATIIANLIGGLIFFWVDKLIFKKTIKYPVWDIQDNVQCYDCGKVGKGYRIVMWNKYDRTEDKNPQYRCEECSKKKAESIKKNLKYT